MFRSRSGNVKSIVTMILGAGVLLWLGFCVIAVLPDILYGRIAARRNASSNQLKQLALALHHYHDAYGRFPAAYLADADGKPMHSWRVLILPFLDEKDLFDRYDFDQPWNSPHNLAVAKQTPAVYESMLLSSKQNKQGLTTYKALAGPNTVLSTEGARSFREIPNGTANTIMTVDDTERPVPWSKPEDISPVDFLSTTWSDGYFQGVNVGLADGSVRFVTDENKEEVRPMVSIGGK
ncbi:DUF1559 domain-containing protein [bacterium]|nr:DUF1559 domain-containing protein [bacterium]